MRYSVRMSWRFLFPTWVVAGILLLGCSSQRIVPESMESLVDRTVSFQDVLASPESYKGRMLVLGGEVLNAKRLHNSTQIELLQLPLEDGEEPSLDRQQSQGRFLALKQEFLDPATMVEGTRVTIVGEVSGSKTDHLDDVEYRYPTLIVKHLHIWRVQSYSQRQPGFSIGLFGGMGVGGGSRGGGGFRLGF
jgi:outer membrane lipoprotein